MEGQLGQEISKAMGLLWISTSVSSEFVECNVVSENLAPVLQAKYPTVFVGVGKLKDYKLKLHINSEATPVAQKPRHVPFALREKVTAKIEDLIAKDIVELVNGLMSWVSPVVIGPKASRHIRLCVDTRKANEAIIRERIPILTSRYLNQTAQPHQQRLEVSWGWSASLHVLFPTSPPLQSLYERSLGRE